MDRQLTIGDVAARTGVAPSALRYYEDRGLISSERTPGNQRRYRRSVLRTVSIIRAAQEAGLSLDEVGTALAPVHEAVTPSMSEWSLVAERLRPHVDRQIAILAALRDELDGCIGCGCVSLPACAVANPEDRAAADGTGARYLGPDRAHDRR
jgi:MerR family redox-sensitive transcriptional activator SoxR